MARERGRSETKSRDGGTPEYRYLDMVDEEPIVLVGRGSTASGVLAFRNVADESVTLRPVLRTGAVALAADRGAVPAPQVYLRAGESRRVPFRVPISPGLAPGEHRVELDIAGRIHPVIVQVFEEMDLSVSPTTIVIENRPGSTVRTRAQFRNRGNVALALGAFAPVPLSTEGLLFHSLRDALVGLPADRRSIEAYVVDVLHRAGELVGAAGHLVVTTAPVTLPPGESTTLELAVHVPAKADRFARLWGRIPLYNNDMEFLLVPVGDKVLAAPAPAPAAPAKRPPAASRARKQVAP